MVTYWIAGHRALIFAIFAVITWSMANYWYLRTDIRRARRLSGPHKWSVDMVTKTTEGDRSKASH